MALINNNYVLVTEEGINRTADTTSHPTEEGLPISDTVRSQPISVSLTGKIVDTDNATAGTIVNKLKNLHKEGSLITYIGQCGTINNLQIQDFSTNYNNKNYGGADFDMTLKEVRIAKKAYVKTKSSNTVKETKKSNDFKVGDFVWFTGGYVYVSSDAAKHSSKRGKSYCKLTKISALKNRKHIYHLINRDCSYGSPNYVYGWVDASKVSAVTKTISKKSSSGGTQQTKKIASGNKYTQVSLK